MDKHRFNALAATMSPAWHRHQAELALAVAQVEAAAAACHCGAQRTVDSHGDSLPCFNCQQNANLRAT